MRDDKVTRRVTINVSYFGIGNAHSISRRGLGLQMSAIHLEVAGQHSVEHRDTSITNSYAPYPSGTKCGLIDELNLNHSHSLFVSFGKVSVTVPTSVL